MCGYRPPARLSVKLLQCKIHHVSPKFGALKFLGKSKGLNVHILAGKIRLCVYLNKTFT